MRVTVLRMAPHRRLAGRTAPEALLRHPASGESGATSTTFLQAASAPARSFLPCHRTMPLLSSVRDAWDRAAAISRTAQGRLGALGHEQAHPELGAGIDVLGIQPQRLAVPLDRSSIFSARKYVSASWAAAPALFGSFLRMSSAPAPRLRRAEPEPARCPAEGSCWGQRPRPPPAPSRMRLSFIVASTQPRRTPKHMPATVRTIDSGFIDSVDRLSAAASGPEGGQLPILAARARRQIRAVARPIPPTPPDSPGRSAPGLRTGRD